MRKHSTLDTRLLDEEVERRNVQRGTRIQPALLLAMEYPIEWIVLKKKSQRGTAPLRGHVSLAYTQLLVVGPAQTHLLPIHLMTSAIHLPFHIRA